ncbi:hypothetical protein V9056_10745 [Streptococcus agalactiae]|uniref:hypothetical protein n=1 Tax=Streptococcus agalactiae TaxID=1311 RepID=UPI00300FA686
MSLFRTSRPREVSVHISFHKDGYRSVSIHGGTADEIGALMKAVLKHPNASATPIEPAEPIEMPEIY